MPLFGCYLPDVCLVPAIVYLFCVDNGQDQFRIDISAGAANTDILIGVIGNPFEVGDRLDRVTVVNRVTAGI